MAAAVAATAALAQKFSSPRKWRSLKVFETSKGDRNSVWCRKSGTEQLPEALRKSIEDDDVEDDFPALVCVCVCTYV